MKQVNWEWVDIRKQKDMNKFSFLHLFTKYVFPLLLFVSLFFLFPTSLFSFVLTPPFNVSILCLYAPLPPSSPRPLPVSPVYEGKFIGLPGAVSWRWPPLLKPQQGFTLHMEKRQHSGHTGLFPSAHITPDNTHAHLPLSANEPHCFLPALFSRSCLLPSHFSKVVAGFLPPFLYFI